MPEGPEVRKTTDFLSMSVDRTISSFTVLSGRYTRTGGIPNAVNAVLPAKIKSVDCKGKFIYFTLTYNNNQEYYLFSTLGMTGMWSSEKSKHARFSISFNDESTLYYNDIRNFGTLKFISDKKVLIKKLNLLGPDVLGSDVTWDLIKSACLRKPNKTIAECLMNQSLISGVGNYLKAEILYDAKISPHRLCKDITEKEFKTLAESCYWVTRLSYKMGGATLSTYRQPNGEKGLYSRRFAVYNQKTDPLGNNVIKEQTLDKRTTHWVPNIQK